MYTCTPGISRVHVIFSDTNIQVYLHKKILLKYRLSDVREGVRLKTKLYVNMCYVLLCVMLLSSWVSRG